MSDEIGSYSFLPWLRQGLANKVQSADGDASVRLRATVRVEVEVKASGLDGAEVSSLHTRDVSLYGPGDIVGIEQRAIVQTEPRNWITNFEPNYLPYVTFYDEDFPWRYSPAAPDATRGRLRPWITLVVLKDAEFADGRDLRGKLLPYIEVADTAATFPVAEELWAWAHVHVNRNLVGGAEDPRSTDLAAVLPAFQAVLAENPDLAYSRLVSPRKLDPNARYHAFLIPTFESGRLAGLGLNPADAPPEVHATFSAWADYSGRTAPSQYPYYHRWVFRTGSEGDFEFLVRLLKPKPAHPRVGRRDLDVQRPGSNITGILDPELGGILRLGGALQVPFDTMKEADKQEVLKYDNWAQPYPHAFQRELAAFINLSDDYNAKTAVEANQDAPLATAITTDPDPWITPPLYGRWHALTRRLLAAPDGSPVPNDDNWVHELNLDPRWRCAGGFGTKVIQENQEAYMDAAWGQVGQVLEANRLLRQAQLAKQVTLAWYQRTVRPLAARGDDRFFALVAPVQSRVMAGAVTAHYQLRQSPVPPALTSAPLRRMLRPRARLMRYSSFDASVRATNLLERVNRQEVTPAPPKTVPPGLPTVDRLAADLKPQGVPGPLWDLLQRNPRVRWVPFVLALLALLLGLLAGGAGLLLGALVAAGLIAVGVALSRLARRAQGAASLRTEGQTPAAVDALPASPDFTVVAAVGEGRADAPIRTGGADGEESVRFKRALRDAYGTVQVSRAAGAVPAPTPVSFAVLAQAAVAAVDPALTIPRYALERVKLPPALAPERPERIEPVMAYPELDIPMYKPLAAISSELLVPNLNLIEENSITLLETNQRFIEAYMVGVNHEFARELLWREYPTDQRGSYFRQFWEVAAQLAERGTDPEVLRERLKDIPPIHTWRRDSSLGDHDHREARRENEEELVLVIRGELLKKYPDALIYARRARWQLKEDGTIDNTKERRFDDSPPLAAKVKTPLYEARVEPDIYFFGFDLVASEARGGTGEDPGDDPGWFFVIQERPGEPRFGLDIERAGGLNVWNDLAWPDVLADPAGGFLRINASTATLSVQEPTGAEEEEHEQWEEDRFLQWHKDTDAAELAYILFQAPMLVGIHAAEMLPRPES